MLILDDFALVPITEEQCRDMLEVADDRSGTGSFIISSQLPVKDWYQTFANATLADEILDRVVHGSYRLALTGPTRRDPKPEEEKSLSTMESFLAIGQIKCAAQAKNLRLRSFASKIKFEVRTNLLKCLESIQFVRIIRYRVSPMIPLNRHSCRDHGCASTGQVV